MSVYIPMESILRDGVNFLSVLRSISSEELRRKQAAVAAIAPRLQYAVVPDRYLPSKSFAMFDARQPLVHGTWDPPMRDAAAVVIERLIDAHTVDPDSGFSTTTLRRKRCVQIDVMANHEIYTGLRLNHSSSSSTTARSSQLILTNESVISNVPRKLWEKYRCHVLMQNITNFGQNFHRGNNYEFRHV